MLSTLKLKKRYEEMVNNIETSKLYIDTSSIDVYSCHNCGNKAYTIYGDRGVTPFIIGCTCGQYMVHNETIKADELPEGRKVMRWIRPTFRQMLRLNSAIMEHVLQGGLILDKDLNANSHET